MSATRAWSTGAGATDIGPRATNQDAYLSDGRVHIVADGMGGHEAGEAASAAVVDVFASLATRDVITPDDISLALIQAQRAVLQVSRTAGGESGTTVTGAVEVTYAGAPWWMVINVGDSRTYLVGDGIAHQITLDHSYVQELVDAGRITADQARHHPDRNIVTRAIGDGVPQFDAWLVPVTPGMRLVIASDGLTNAVDDRRIGHIASVPADPHDAAVALVDAALAAGTGDNVTVVVADAREGHTPPGLDVSPWRQWADGAEVDENEDDSTQTSRRRRRA